MICAASKVGFERGKVGEGSRDERGVSPFREFLERQPPRRRVLAKLRDHSLAVCIRCTQFEAARHLAEV